MSEATEHQMGGGQTGGVVRCGATIRRPVNARSEYIHSLLRYLEGVGFDGAPRYCGIDELGRAILTFIDGDVIAWAPELVSDDHIRSIGHLTRRLHDATAGTHLAGDSEVVCHRDLGAHNTVFAGTRAVALIDWDAAGPGSRLYDIADACWSFADIGGDRLSIGEQARRVSVLCAAYGWNDKPGVLCEITRHIEVALTESLNKRSRMTAVFERYTHWMHDHAAELRALLG